MHLQFKKKKTALGEAGRACAGGNYSSACIAELVAPENDNGCILSYRADLKRPADAALLFKKNWDSGFLRLEV